MRNFFAALLSLVAGILSIPHVAAADEPATLTVTGQGVVSRSPDEATVAVTIVTNDDDARRALSENNRRYSGLIGKLATTGIAAADITSTSIQSYFNPRPAQAGPAAPGQLYGFVVTRNAAIAVAQVAQTGAIVDAATAAGATQINGVSFGLRDRRAAERAALAAAVADAAAQAQAIAGAAHVQVVRVQHIGNEPPQRFMPLAKTMLAAEAPAPTAITPSDLDVTATVTITYVIR